MLLEVQLYSMCCNCGHYIVDVKGFDCVKYKIFTYCSSHTVLLDNSTLNH